MKLSSIDVRDVISDILLDMGSPIEDIALYEQRTQPLVGLMGRPICTELKLEEIRELVIKLCAPSKGYGNDPDVTNGGLMDFGYTYGHMVEVINIATADLEEMYHDN